MCRIHPLCTRVIRHDFSRSDLCFATTNRQTALKELGANCDVLLIIGSSDSSNTLALEKIAKEMGVTRVHRIDSAQCLNEIELFDEDIVGITAGASAPEDIVQEVISACKAKDGTEYLSVIDEDEYFPPPSQLRNLVLDYNFALDAVFASRALQEDEDRESPDLVSVFSKDRSESASDSLVSN